MSAARAPQSCGLAADMEAGRSTGLRLPMKCVTSPA